MKSVSFVAALCCALSACAGENAGQTEAGAPAESAEATRMQSELSLPYDEVAARLDEIARENGLVTAGFGVIRDGALRWTHYYGEETPGVPASDATRFNVASITKTVAAETALRLAERGEFDLDEPLSNYWIDPDIADDPRLDQLTARLVLTHRTGFPNWRFFTESRKLSFEKEPGSAYTYSGEGFDYLMRALEKKLERPFPEIVGETVFEPVGMSSARIEVDRKNVEHIARPVDADGKFPGYYCYPHGWCSEEGRYTAADDMVVSVPDYARFMVSVMKREGYGAALEEERNHVYTDEGENRVVACDDRAPIECPEAQGYGLGFQIVQYDDKTVVGHGGSDWAEFALAYFYQPANDGVLIFLNAPNAQGLDAMPELIAALDEGSPYISRYRRWRARAAEKESAE